MTALMQRALRRLTEVPESKQDRLARRVLSLPELADTDTPEKAKDETPVSLPSLVSIASEPNGYSRSKEEIDRELNALRDEWER